ncbi:MAG: histidinol dehydrogenase, partial [Desulfovibrio sp.]|nr:histidinol dehydrogenase [Desulfovibrio sp.]
MKTFAEWLTQSRWLKERAKPKSEVEIAVRDIITNVVEKRDEALIDYTMRFDCPTFSPPIQ